MRLMRACNILFYCSEISRDTALPTRLNVYPASGQADQSLRCPLSDALDSWLPTDYPTKTLIRLSRCAG